ncbi:MAG: RNA polymerase sigma factor [Acidimicrobiales bacterium]
MEHLPDHELLVVARTDATAFGVFYRRHVHAVHSYFRRRVGSGEVAFDLTAETFAAALAAVPRYAPGPEPAEAWLFAIARNTLSASLRRRRVEDRTRRALEMAPIELSSYDLTFLETEEPGPAVAALAELPAEQRSAIEAHHLEGSSYAEIARRLRCSQSVVRQRVSRGLRALHTRMKERTDG